MKKIQNVDCVLSKCMYHRQHCYDCQFSRLFRKEENVVRWALCPYYKSCSMNKDNCYSCYKYIRGKL